MNRWMTYRAGWDDYPQTWFDIDVFLSNAIMHLRNRGSEVDARMLISDARDRLLDARNGGSILAKVEVAA